MRSFKHCIKKTEFAKVKLTFFNGLKLIFLKKDCWFRKEIECLVFPGIYLFILRLSKPMQNLKNGN